MSESIAYLVAWHDFDSHENEGYCIKKGSLADAFRNDYQWRLDERPSWLKMSYPRIMICDNDALDEFLGVENMKYIKRFDIQRTGKLLGFKKPSKKELESIYKDLAPELIDLKSSDLPKLTHMFNEGSIFFE